MKKARCKDCGLVYGSKKWRTDLTLPNAQWKVINGSSDGVLCANCICNRAGNMGAVAVRACLDFCDGVVGNQELLGILQGLVDAANGRVKSLKQIKRELCVPRSGGKGEK